MARPHGSDINCGARALGPGRHGQRDDRPRAPPDLVNADGASAGVISTSTFGNSARYACCFGEYEEESGWEPLHVEHDFSTGDSTVAALAGGEPLRIVNDPKGRGAADLLTTIARILLVVAHHKAY